MRVCTVQFILHTFFFVQCPFSSYFFGQVQPRQVNQMLQDYLVFSVYLFSIVRYTSHISLPGPPRDQRSGLGKGQAKGLGKGQNQQSSSTSSSNSGQSSPSPPPGKGRGGPKGAKPFPTCWTGCHPPPVFKEDKYAVSSPPSEQSCFHLPVLVQEFSPKLVDSHSQAVLQIPVPDFCTGADLHQCFEERVQFEHGSGDLSLLWLEMPVVQQVQCFLHTNLPDVAVKGII